VNAGMSIVNTPGGGSRAAEQSARSRGGKQRPGARERMPTERLSMRNTREILRQKWLLKRPHRAIRESVGVSVGAVCLALERAAAAQLTWEGVEELDDAQLEARLYPSVVAAALRWSPTARGFTGSAIDPA
jgi:hypothetical protein